MNNQRTILMTLTTIVVILVIGAVVFMVKPRSIKNNSAGVSNDNASTVNTETEVSCGVILQPPSGTIVASGNAVNVQINFKGAIWDTVELLSEGADIATIDPATGKGVLKIPATFSGPMKLTLLGVRGKNEICSGESLVFFVRPNASIKQLFILPTKIYLGPGETESILVSAKYDDGVERSANSPIVGTTYTSLHPSIATVDREGLVTGRTLGITNITVQNGTLFENITVKVLETTKE